MVDCVSSVTGVPSADIKSSVRITNSKKYISVTIQAPVKNADMLYEVYEVLSKDPRVKFKF